MESTKIIVYGLIRFDVKDDQSITNVAMVDGDARNDKAHKFTELELRVPNRVIVSFSGVR